MVLPLTNSSVPVRITPAELRFIPTPRPTRTWQPVPHSVVLDAVERRLHKTGAEIHNRHLIVSHGGARFFGTLTVRKGDAPEGCSPVIGVRNASDQRFALGLASGLRVLVCSNLSFSGEQVLSRKHTTHIMQELPDLIANAVDHVEVIWARQSVQIDAYRSTRLTDLRAHDLTVRAVDTGVISASRIPDLVQEWREPSHEEFRPRTVYSFFNAATEALKKSNPFSLPARTQKLHKLCDQHVGLA